MYIHSAANGRARHWRAVARRTTLCVIASSAVFAAGCRKASTSAISHLKNGPAPIFTDITARSGLDYRWTIQGKRPLNILQTIGNGCAFLDYNGDGNLDILLVGPQLRLYRGDGNGHFTDVSEETGVNSFTGHFLGCAVGDYDGDGYDDIYVSAYRGGILLHNEAGRRFRDVTSQAGLAPQPWGTSCGFVESCPGSGRLDLYICNYADFGPNTNPQLCEEHGLKTSCGPRYYKPIHGVFYLNVGGGRFKDSTAVSGMDKVSGRALGVSFADLGHDHRPTIAIANDEMPGDLLIPRQDRSPPWYKNTATLAGTAYDRDGNIHGGMGADWGDYDNDGRLDLFVTTFEGEPNSLYHNEGDDMFSDVATPTGIAGPTTPYVAFGCKFLDYDNDGWLDIAVANGHVQDNIQEIYKTHSYRQSAQLFRNRGGSPTTFEDMSARAGPEFTKPIVGRGLATGDLDNDGRIDVLIVDSESRPMLLHNECPNAGNWLGIRLVGGKSNRDGYGAILTARIDGRTLVRQCQSSGSYLSASDKRVHFGLGAADKIDTLTVAWPSGKSRTYSNLAANRYITLHEEDTTIR